MIEIKRDTIIGDILDVAPQTAPIFLSIGMHCLGCPSSRGETVEEACMVHGIDVEKLLALVNEEPTSLSRNKKRTHTGLPYASCSLSERRRRWKRNYSFSRGCNASQALCRRARDWPTSAPTMGIFRVAFAARAH